MAVTLTHGRRSLNDDIAARIRAVLALRGMTQNELAARMAVPPLWLSRRLSATSKRAVSMNLDELEQIAGALGIPVRSLLDPQWLPHLDSNQEPAGNRRHLTLLRAAS